MLADSLRGVSLSATLLERELDAVARQKVWMENGGGISIWPKPILHPLLAKDGFDNLSYVDINPCGFCNRGFHCFDVVLTSCRHAFHPFCISEVARTGNKCVVCEELFHPDWWRSWGFRGVDEEIEGQPPSRTQQSIAMSLKEALSLSESRPTRECPQLSILISVYFKNVP